MSTRSSVVAKSIWICFFIGLFSLGMSHVKADTLEHTYAIPEPQVLPVELQVLEDRAAEAFDRITIPGLPSNAEPGSPVLPMLPVRLLVPQGHRVERIEVISEEFKRLEGTFRLPPSQRAYPLSLASSRKPTAPDPLVYASNGFVPEKIRSDHSIQYGRGFQFVFFNLFPVRYVPAKQEVFYTSSMTVKIITRPGSSPHGVMRCRNTLSDRAWARGQVQNSEAVDAYCTATPPAKGKTNRGKRNSLNQSRSMQNPNGPMQGPKIDDFKKPYPWPQSGSYIPYVIITTEAIAADPGPYNFQDLLAHRLERGMPGMIKTVEEIYAQFGGQDEQEKIRNFCRYAYNHYQAEYILLGGDGHDNGPNRVVPARGMWVEAEGEIETNLKSDLYYSNLDGSFNENQNSRWGEIDDGPDGADVDLISELYVGRACVLTPEELHNFVYKTIAYETDDYTEPWYTRGHFIGEFLWGNPNTWGGDYMDEVKDGADTHGYETVGYPATWNCTTQYQRDGFWWPSQLINLLNSNQLHLVNHLGHASPSMVMKLYAQDVVNLTNTRYFFIYSQGCSAGSFATTDCMAELFTVTEHGAFGVVMNDKYGWGELGCTDGSSQYFHREFMDAVFGEGLVEAGRANADSKEDNIWSVNYKSNRWCLYETNLFGDPATPLIGAMLSSKAQLALDRPAYGDDGLVQVTLKDMDLNTSAGVHDEVTLSLSATQGDAEEVVLVETHENSSIFTGTILVTQGAPSPGNQVLNLAHGESFEVEYIDASDGFGGVNVHVYAEAEGDFIAPVVSNVQLVTISDSSAIVGWDANEPTTGTLVYGLNGAPQDMASNAQLLSSMSVCAEDLLSCSEYSYYVVAADAAGNETVMDNGGAYYSFETQQRFFALREEMNADPNWSITPGSLWEWGRPLGNHYDPDYGYTGPAVYGYNLEGPYTNNMGKRYLTTPAIDCSQLRETRLDFWRKLITQYRDNASLEVSVNGSDWVEIFHNDISAFIEPCWLHYVYDISDVADLEPTVYIRWVMGPSNEGTVTGGWNIDDVIVSGVAAPSMSWMEHSGHALDDTQGGNGNGFVEPKESIVMSLTMYNMGLDATTVSAQLVSYTPGVTILDGQADFPSIDCHGTGSSMVPHFSYFVSEDMKDSEEIILGVDWTAGSDSGSFTIIDQVMSPNLVCVGSEVMDDTGDNDGYLDPGETVMIEVSLENKGSIVAENVTAELTCSHPQWITIIDPTVEFGDIAVNGINKSINPHFTVYVDPATPNYTWIDFTLQIQGDNYAGEEIFQIEATDCVPHYTWMLDEDPEWIGTKLWEFGEPQGKKAPNVGMGCPDPDSGYTGNNVLGYNLVGGYSLNMGAETMTSTAIDCSGIEAVKVRFKRWLGVASAQFDYAGFQVSIDQVNWIPIWEHTEYNSISDDAWVPMEFDISSIADHAPTLYLRWVMGPTSYSWVFCGWNVDDIEIWGR